MDLRHTLKALGAVLTIGLVLLFQNCGGGLKADRASDFSSSSSNTSGPTVDAGASDPAIPVVPAPPINPADPLAIHAIDSVKIENREALIEFRLNRISATPIIVNWVTEDASAASDNHYVQSAGSATISPGDLSTLIKVPIIRSEPGLDTAFTVKIISVTGAGVGRAVAVVRIAKNSVNYQFRNAWRKFPVLPIFEARAYPVSLGTRVYVRSASDDSPGAILDLKTWTAKVVSAVGAPPTRLQDFAAATNGSKVGIFGGRVSNGNAMFTENRDVFIYDPKGDSWKIASRLGSPFLNMSTSSFPCVAWAGSKFIVFGRTTDSLTGGLYDPSTDTWSPMSTQGAIPCGSTLGVPTARPVWTGKKLIVLNISGDMTGSIYDLESNTWTPFANIGAPSPRRLTHAVWTGDRLLVWGGFANGGGNYSDQSSYLRDGGEFDPNTSTWTRMGTSGALPAARLFHGALWSGTHFLVYGGRLSGSLNSTEGGFYDPTSRAWVQISDSRPAEIFGRAGMIPVMTAYGMFIYGWWDSSAPGAGLLE